MVLRSPHPLCSAQMANDTPDAGAMIRTTRVLSAASARCVRQRGPRSCSRRRGWRHSHKAMATKMATNSENRTTASLRVFF